jgi:hypothetical protein
MLLMAKLKELAALKQLLILNAIFKRQVPACETDRRTKRYGLLFCSAGLCKNIRFQKIISSLNKCTVSRMVSRNIRLGCLQGFINTHPAWNFPGAAPASPEIKQELPLSCGVHEICVKKNSASER